MAEAQRRGQAGRVEAADTHVGAYDAIVVGARVAGSATAHLLAGMGWRVALVERKARPLGQTLSLPITQPRGLARFQALGLLPAIEGIMPRLKQVRTLRLGLAGGLVIAGAVPPAQGFDYGVILRREALDDALLDFVIAAHPDAITLYDGTNVDELVMEDGRARGVKVHSNSQPGRTGTLNAPLVIGADGRFSQVARLVGARAYGVRTSFTTLFYSYGRGMDFSGLSDVTFLTAANQRMVVFSDVGEGLQVMSAWFPVAQYASFRRDPVGELRATWESVPELRERMARAELLGKTMGLAPQEGYFRPMGGAGWALVGDARHFKDPASGQGLHDALYSVQQLGEAISAATGGRTLRDDEALRRFQKEIAHAQAMSDRELKPMYTFTYTFAEGLVRPPTLPERLLLRAIAGDPAIAQRFLGINSGATDVRAFNRAAPLYLLRGLQLSLRRRNVAGMTDADAR